MRNTMYIPNSLYAKKNLKQVILDYNLQKNNINFKNEVLYKNENLFLLYTQKYIFLATLSSECDNIILEIKNHLMK